MRTQVVIAATAAMAVAAAELQWDATRDTILIDGTAADLVYDGHGALSAGASSRLLIDYDNNTRSEILDLLFKPNYGASMHLIKVEIGGDGQSTDGTEASHMHYRDDLSCKRGYEFWLLQEARARNPDIKTYALSWASPWWVGNQTGYYSDDEIDYHIKWLQCTKEWNIGNIDYMGNWNERPWGNANWTKHFKQAMVDAGFPNTQIIIPDGGGMSSDIAQGFATDPEFKAAIYAIGQHYPCDRPEPTIMNTYSKKFWSSEDYSTVGDWAGAGCWGRLLNQNFVRMNQTSTISWSLIWSVYNPGFPYFGNGLMYAMTPWSGFYEAGQDGTNNGVAIWTNAHTCQFTQVGWKYVPLGSGSGTLSNGGSYVSLVSPDGNDFTLVVEKLEGRCLRCAGQETSDEVVQFKLGPTLTHIRTLQMWSTNLTARFISNGNITISGDGQFSFLVQADSIVTVSSWFNGQKKAVMPPLVADTIFPLEYTDNFDNYDVDAEAKYFADNGGSFQIAANPNGQGMVMKQWALNENGVNRWGRNVPPISLISNNPNWTMPRMSSVDILIGSGPTQPTVGSPPPPAGYYLWRNTYNGQCLDVKGKQTSDGSTVDTWTCVSADNEHFAHDPTTGHLIEMGTGKCVVSVMPTGPGAACSKDSTKFCIVECSSDSSLSWTFNTDGTIRPKDAPNQCVQVAAKTLDATVFLAPCTVPPTSAMVWTNITSAPPGPSPPGPPPPSVPYAGLCVATDRSADGLCLFIDVTGKWTLGGSSGSAGNITKNPTKEWVNLGIKTMNGQAIAVIDGVDQPAIPFSPSNIMNSINSGWNLAYFDNFKMGQP